MTCTLRGDVREVQRLLDRGVAAADDADVLAAIEEAVAGGAAADAAAHERLLGRQAEVLGRGAGGDDQRVAGVVAGVAAQVNGRLREIDRVDVVEHDLGVEALGVLQEALHQVRALHAVDVGRPVVDVGRRHQLAALRDAGDEHRLQVGARGVDRGGVAGGAGAEDQDSGVCVGEAMGTKVAVSVRQRRGKSDMGATRMASTLSIGDNSVAPRGRDAIARRSSGMRTSTRKALTMAMLSNLDLIRRVPLFSLLTNEQAQGFADSVVKRRFRRGEIIVEHGKKSNALFILLTGRARVLTSDTRGREVILAVLQPGDYVGEMSLIDNEPHSATVRAEVQTDMLVLGRAEFARCLPENSSLSYAIMRGLVQRLRSADRQIESLALLDVYGRVARTLLDMSEMDGEVKVIRNKVSRQDIAKIVGASREMVSRVMKDLEDRGMVADAGKRLGDHQGAADRLTACAWQTHAVGALLHARRRGLAAGRSERSNRDRDDLSARFTARRSAPIRRSSRDAAAGHLAPHWREQAAAPGRRRRLAARAARAGYAQRGRSRRSRRRAAARRSTTAPASSAPGSPTSASSCRLFGLVG